MPTLEQLATTEQIKEEYRKTFLLNLFQKLCIKMNKNVAYRKKNLVLYRQSCDCVETTRIIIKKEFTYDLDLEEAQIIHKWLSAYFKKSTSRKRISQETKLWLYERQSGKCIICGEDLGKDWSDIHVDHIIPWMLVGDELEDNYQLLCDTCNQCKSSRTDYIFKSLLGLN